MTGQRVLVVDDDPTVAEVVTRYLEREGYDVEAIHDGATAVDRALTDLPAVVVLDLMLPGLDGLEVCRRLRAIAPIPVIMLTARGEEQDRVMGLELGADDYLAKPFSPGCGLLAFDDLEVDLGARQIRVHNTLVALTPREFELLAFLARSPRRVFRREELLERVWGFTYGDTATVTVHMRRLREKLEADPSTPRHLVTVWGVGYRLDP